MKKYIKPVANIVEINGDEMLVAGSLGKEYNSDDVSYGKKRTNPEDIKQPEYGNLW